MPRDCIDRNRRRLTLVALTGAVVPPAMNLVGVRTSRAADLPHLSTDDPQAKGLSYVHDAAEAKGHSTYREGAHCANCQQWKGGEAEWGGCNIFPGKAVNRDGWCTAWVAAQG